MTDLAGRLSTLSPAQRAALAARLAETPARPQSVAIAVIGIGCRFPGGATSPEAFWDRLLAGFDAIGEVPTERWTEETNVSPDTEASGTTTPRWGGFLESIDQFEPGFFGLSPREAAHMDPQQRLLLETAWEALEDAGQMTPQLAASATGVFIGAQSHSSDYYRLQAENLDRIETYTATGTAHSILANRLSFIFDLQGPSMAIDTACSSSLVAVHLACQSLRVGDCDRALAGGVNLILTPDFHACLGKLEMLAPDGRCKTFDDRANGFVRGEGCGIVVLKRMTDAVRDGDPVLAVIRGSAVNQDGASNGLTAPNGIAQQAVIRRSLEMAQVRPEDISYVETHGTGTVLGDPIEIEALAKTLRSGQEQPRQPCVLGAVKTNIGHLEAASGIAGLIKVVLSLRNEAIPANLHLQTLNPHLAESAARFILPDATQPWPRSDRPRVAGVSSFGFGGTNAHVILSEPPRDPTPVRSSPLTVPMLLPISARSAEALSALTRAQIAFLRGEQAASLSPTDLAFTAAHRRLHHDFRACAVGTSGIDWAASFERSRAPVPREGAPELAFAFPGQGRPGAQGGAGLFATEPVFREVIDHCDALVRCESSWSIVDELRAPASQSRLARADIGHPVLVAIQAGLVALWRSWGVQPSWIVGHGIGEVAAAHAAGALTLEQAVRVAVRRGAILQDATVLGGMAKVGLSRRDAETLIASVRPSIKLATVNDSVFLCGDTLSLQTLIGDLHDRKIFAQMLETDHPAYALQLSSFADSLERALDGLVPKAPDCPIVSTVTGRRADAGAFGAHYWAQSLCQPIVFHEAIHALFEEGCSTFLEIGPHPVLRPAIRQCETEGGLRSTIVASLEADRDERRSMLEGAAALYVNGVDLNWTQITPTEGRCVELPRYPWIRQRTWLSLPEKQGSGLTAEANTPPEGAPAHWFYNLVWRHHGQCRGAVSAFAGAHLERSAASVARLVERSLVGKVDAVESRRSLDAASIGSIATAFKALGADLSPGSAWPKRHLAGLLHIQSRFRRLLQRLLAILVDAGILLDELEHWRVAETASYALYAPVKPTGLDPGPINDLQARCGSQLAKVLVGEIEPLELLFSHDGGSTAEAIYRDAEPSDRANRLLAHAVQDWLSTLPADRKLRILEIGGGTGATTAAILSCLPEKRCDYVFTDVSNHFLRTAAERFASYPFVRFAPLDLERSPESQGFIDTQFDLIIAANVVHATQDLSVSLGHLQHLLADQGILALLECTASRPWMDITFGLTSGWWRFTDLHLRQTNPLLSEGAWTALLQQIGFEHVSAVPLQGRDGDPLFDMALLFAQRSLGNEEAATSNAIRPRSLWSGRALIVDDGSGMAAPLLHRLEQRGDSGVIVGAGQRLEPARPEHKPMESAGIHEILEAREGDLEVVIYLAACAGADGLDAGGRLLTLIQALLKTKSVPRKGVWVVTRGCQPPGPVSPATLGQSLLWGLGRGVSLEAPQLAPTLIDLDPGTSPTEMAAALLAELDNADGEDQICLRDGARYVPRIEPINPGGRPGGSLKVSGRHLITGGLGGIGSRLALNLARAGASELVLIVRHGLPERSQWADLELADKDFDRVDTVRRLEAEGVSVVVEIVDLADDNALTACLGSVLRTGSALRGVWHTAMSLSTQTIVDLESATLRAMVEIKSRAAFRLHELTRDQPLDHFVLFSSTTALWGGSGLAHYAAANAYLDALAHSRRAERRPALVVNWGLWETMGRGTEAQHKEAQRVGLRPMKAAAALAALGEAVVANSTQTIIADVDWSTFKSAYEAQRSRPLLTGLGLPVSNPPERNDSSFDALGGLAAATPDERGEIIGSLVKKELAAVLGLAPHDPLDRRKGFFELGMDSLTSLQFRRRLEATFMRPLLSTLTFKYPTVDSLSQHLTEVLVPTVKVEQELVVLQSSPSDTTEEPPNQFEESENELFEQLAARLASKR